MSRRPTKEALQLSRAFNEYGKQLREVADARIAQIEAENKRLRAALEKIAKWDCLSVQAKTGMTLMSQVGLIQATAQAAIAEQPAESENPLCVCNHRLNTHNPCCVSACGCDGFISADKPLTDAQVDALMAADAEQPTE